MENPAGKSRYRMLGRYAISDEIAAGGMASVHLGRLVGPVAFTRTVAIKRMHEHLVDDDEMRARFLDEARLAARIRHPNVVPTLDVIADEGEVYIVMEYVQGTSLGRLIAAAKEGRVNLPARVVASIIAEALHGLHAAHEAKSDQGEPLMLVHRDVSPQNILIGGDGTTRVADFGIAKARKRKFETMDGKLRGKLKYMAPEQLRGGDIDRRADIYSAGVCLWECLAGQRIHEGLEDMAIMGRLAVGTRPVPPSSVRVCPGLSAEQSASADMITVRALSVESKDRYPTALAMATAIENNLPLATRVEIVEWLESLVGPAMAAWTKRVEAFEREPIDVTDAPAARAPSISPAKTLGMDDTLPVSHFMDAAPVSLTHTSTPPREPAPEAAPVPLQRTTQAMAPLAPSRAPPPLEAPAPEAPRRSSRARLYAVLVPFIATCLLGGVVIAMVMSSRSAAKQASASTVAPPASSPPTPSASATTSVAAAAPPPADSNFPAEVMTGRKGHQGRRHGAGASAPGARGPDTAAPPTGEVTARPPPDCDPPYTRDPTTGVIMHKPHCLGAP